MSLQDLENAMRQAAKAWADANSLAFSWDNAQPRDPAAAPTLVWSWRPDEPENLTDQLVRRSGQVEAELWVVGVGGGIATALQLAESLRAEFAGRTFGDGQAQAEVEIRRVGRREGGCVAEVVLPWDLFEHVVPLGSIGAHATPSALLAHGVVRERWETRVRAPLGLRTLYDNSPPDAAEPPPWAFVSVHLLRPIRIEVGTLRVPGRAIAALNHEVGSGVQAANLAASTIERAFHQVTIRGVCFGTPSVTRVGRTPVDTWQTNVRLPFHYDVRS